MTGLRFINLSPNLHSGIDWRKAKLTQKLQKDLVYRPGSRAVTTCLEGGKPRIIGTLDLQ